MGQLENGFIYIGCGNEFQVKCNASHAGCCFCQLSSRYPRAYAAWHLKFKFELNLPFVHSFLMLHVPPDDGLIQPHSRREEPRRPQHRSPVHPLQFGIPEPQLPTQIRFHLAHNTRDRIFRRYHQHHVDMSICTLHCGTSTSG
jgi:hypothetical protein